MDWKFVLVFSLITMAIDSSLAKKRKVYRTKTLSPTCSKCLDEIHADKSDGCDPADRSRYKPRPVVRRRTIKNLSSSCVSCIKFLETKVKRMNRYKISKNRFKSPKQGKNFRPDFQDWFKAITGKKQFHPGKAPAPGRGSNINYNFFILMKSPPGSRKTSDSTKTSQIGLRSDERGSETAQSNFKVIALSADETTQVSGETTQSSSEDSATGEETTQVGGETTQSSSEDSATGEETTQISEETTQSTSEVNATSSESIQMIVVTAQFSPEFSASGNETTPKEGQPNKQSALALAVALFVPALSPLLGSRANVNYDYD